MIAGNQVTYKSVVDAIDQVKGRSGSEYVYSIISSDALDKAKEICLSSIQKFDSDPTFDEYIKSVQSDINTGDRLYKHKANSYDELLEFISANSIASYIKDILLELKRWI